MLLLGSRTRVTFISPSGCKWLRQNSFSPIILSRVIFRAAYRRNRTAQAATSLGSSLAKVTFSLKTGLGPLWMFVLPLCFLLGRSTTWTCQELTPLRSLSGSPWALTMVTVSFWAIALYSKMISRWPHFEMGSKSLGGTCRLVPSCSCYKQRGVGNEDRKWWWLIAPWQVTAPRCFLGSQAFWWPTHGLLLC